MCNLRSDGSGNALPERNIAVYKTVGTKKAIQIRYDDIRLEDYYDQTELLLIQDQLFTCSYTPLMILSLIK